MSDKNKRAIVKKEDNHPVFVETIKERKKALVELRKRAIPHIKALDKILHEGCKYTEDDIDEANEYLLNNPAGTSLNAMFRRLKLRREGRFKQLGEEIINDTKE